MAAMRRLHGCKVAALPLPAKSERHRTSSVLQQPRQQRPQHPQQTSRLSTGMSATFVVGLLLLAAKRRSQTQSRASTRLQPVVCQAMSIDEQSAVDRSPSMQNSEAESSPNITSPTESERDVIAKRHRILDKSGDVWQRAAAIEQRMKEGSESAGSSPPKTSVSAASSSQKPYESSATPQKSLVEESQTASEDSPPPEPKAMWVQEASTMLLRTPISWFREVAPIRSRVDRASSSTRALSTSRAPTPPVAQSP